MMPGSPRPVLRPRPNSLNPVVRVRSGLVRVALIFAALNIYHKFNQLKECGQGGQGGQGGIQPITCARACFLFLYCIFLL